MAALQIAQDLLRTVGPGRIALTDGDPDLETALRMAGCVVALFEVRAPLQGRVDTVVVGASTMAAFAQRPAELFARLWQVHSRFVALFAHSARAALAALGTAASTDRWLTAAIESGFRRAVAGFGLAEYAAANEPTLPPLLVLERVEEPDAGRSTLQWLRANRDLHMDMTREAGPRADAHLVRYALAAHWVRPSDTVLDCACGLGYGTALLAAQSRGRRFIGVDVDADAVRYAREHFGSRYGAQFHAADGARLGFLPAASVDLIVSFETLEHMPDYEALLAEFARVLKPDGRIIASVPNRWVDETGRDPNPHHFHAFDWARLAAAFEGRFLIEKRYRQEAPGGFKLTQAARNLQEWPLAQPAVDTEWWIVVASADPRQRTQRPYRHPDFHVSVRSGAHVADFGRYYDNPWLYRPLVQMGERISDGQRLRELCLDVMSAAPSDSADFGAAATVLAYSLLADPGRSAFAADLYTVADGYLAADSANPHVRRWQISLGYATAQLALSLGERQRAEYWFEAVAARDALAFSPLLATKTVAAGFWRAILALVDGRREIARSSLTAAIAAARAALHADDREAIGTPERPLSFGFAELAEVADMASQCAVALNNLEEFERAPGKFWALVDVRRFGLASWAQALERENGELRRALAQLQGLLVSMRPSAARGAQIVPT
ncbi:MAG: class I SAM-dependent methyltransferase [Burkholderiaceae bacterium]|nr:class I SAM-dependent methyltransferase [Burkholderiaceae bacterium]